MAEEEGETAPASVKPERQMDMFVAKYYFAGNYYFARHECGGCTKDERQQQQP